jgi:hypothetical protein
MIPMAAARRLGPWLVGLFLVAQVFGIVPLMRGHTAHVAETQLVLSRGNAGAGVIPQTTIITVAMRMASSSTMNCRT